MKIKLKLFLILFLTTSVNFFSSAIDFDKIVNNLAKLANVIMDENTGLIKSIENMKRSANAIKAFSACKKAKDRSIAVIPIDQNTKIACNNLKGLISIGLLPIIDLLGFKIIGNNENPGLLYIILNLLESSGTKVDKVKSVTDNISKVFTAVDKILKGLEEKAIVK